MNKNNYYVYALVDPQTYLPFYIGKGKDNRKWQHLKEAEKTNKHTRKINKIKNLRIDGFEPIVIELYSNLSNETALTLEANLIQKLKRIEDGGILTNVTIGGEGAAGYKQSDEHKNKKVLTRRKNGTYNISSELTEKYKVGLQKGRENRDYYSIEYEIFSPNGVFYSIFKRQKLQDFCTENNLSFRQALKNLNNGPITKVPQPYRKSQINTIGWEFKTKGNIITTPSKNEKK